MPAAAQENWLGMGNPPLPGFPTSHRASPLSRHRGQVHRTACRDGTSRRAKFDRRLSETTPAKLNEKMRRVIGLGSHKTGIKF